MRPGRPAHLHTIQWQERSCARAASTAWAVHGTDLTRSCGQLPDRDALRYPHQSAWTTAGPAHVPCRRSGPPPATSAAWLLRPAEYEDGAANGANHIHALARRLASHTRPYLIKVNPLSLSLSTYILPFLPPSLPQQCRHICSSGKVPYSSTARVPMRISHAAQHVLRLLTLLCEIIAMRSAASRSEGLRS